MKNEEPKINTAPELSKKETVELIERETEARKKNVSLDRYAAAMEVQTTFMNPNVWTQILSMSKVFFQSRAIPSYIKNEQQLVMVFQAGIEMGMAPMESLHSLYPVNGSFNIWGKAVTRRLRVHGWRIQYRNESPESCTAVVSKNGEEIEDTFTFKMAQDSGYTTHTKDGQTLLKFGWKLGANRKLKLRYGVLNMIIKSYIPEVLGSAAGIQEIDGEVVEETMQIEEKNTPAITPSVKPMTVTGLNNLSERLSESREARDKRLMQRATITSDNLKPLTKAGVVEGATVLE